MPGEDCRLIYATCKDQPVFQGDWWCGVRVDWLQPSVAIPLLHAITQITVPVCIYWCIQFLFLLIVEVSCKVPNWSWNGLHRAVFLCLPFFVFFFFSVPHGHLPDKSFIKALKLSWMDCLRVSSHLVKRDGKEIWVFSSPALSQHLCPYNVSESTEISQTKGLGIFCLEYLLWNLTEI